MELPPGAVATTFAELVEVFSSGAYAADAAAARRARFRARFCYLDDGGAAERVVRRVLLAGTSK
jgi:CDP-glycerol glycerophosphotransferase